MIVYMGQLGWHFTCMYLLTDSVQAIIMIYGVNVLMMKCINVFVIDCCYNYAFLTHVASLYILFYD